MEQTKIHFKVYQPMPRLISFCLMLASLISTAGGAVLVTRKSDPNGWIPVIAGLLLFLSTLFFANKHRWEAFKKYIILDEAQILIKNGLFSRRTYPWKAFRSISIENFEPILFLEDGSAIILPMDFHQNKRFRKALMLKKQDHGL